MCLYIGKNKVKKAEQDIVCYKIVREDADGNCVSPFQDTVISHKSRIIGYVFRKREILPLKFRVWFENLFTPTPCRAVLAGGIHTYRDFDYAKEYRYYTSNSRLYKCVIPKGTPYIEGNNIFLSESIDNVCCCSESIKFVERVL